MSDFTIDGLIAGFCSGLSRRRGRHTRLHPIASQNTHGLIVFNRRLDGDPERPRPPEHRSPPRTPWARGPVGIESYGPQVYWAPSPLGPQVSWAPQVPMGSPSVPSGYRKSFTGTPGDPRPGPLGERHRSPEKPWEPNIPWWSPRKDAHRKVPTKVCPLIVCGGLPRAPR